VIQLLCRNLLNPWQSGRFLAAALLTWLYFVYAPVPCLADWVPYTRATLEQIYDSNIFLESEGEHGHDSKSDFRTNITPTIGIRNESQFRLFSLEYSPSYSWFAKNHHESYMRHTAAFDFNQDLSSRLSIYANDSFDYNEEPQEEPGEETSTAVNYGRRKNIRNSGEGGIIYQFGQENILRFYYYDNRLIYPSDSGYDYEGGELSSSDDSVEYSPGAEIIYWLNQRNGMDFLYEWQRVDYEIRESRRIDHLDMGYTYRWSPHTTLRIDYILDNVRNYGRLSPDYKIHQAQAGFERIFSPSFTLSMFGGFYHRSMEDSQLEEETGLDIGSSHNNGFMGHMDVGYTRSHWSITAAAEGGIRLEFADYNNRGFTPYREFSIDGRYDFTERLHGTLSLSYTHEMSPDTLMALVEGDHRTETYNISAGLKYLLLEWLTCSFEYDYNDQSETQFSDMTPTGYNDHVFMLRLSATYDWLKHEKRTKQNYGTHTKSIGGTTGSI